MVIDLGKPKVLKGLLAQRRGNAFVGFEGFVLPSRTLSRSAWSSGPVIPVSSVFC
jgi:hypothetical protein